MTTINDTGVEALRARVGSTLAGRLGAHIERLDWDAGKLERFQRDELRRLLAHAVERSPFHARRLLGIDPERFELEQLALLPVMSKEQMMSSFDELLTDRRLTRARVEEHLAALGTQPSLVDDDYLCLASGGSSGLRGVFVQRLEEWLEFVACIVRRGMAAVIAAGGPPPGGHPIGIVAAAAPVHSSGFGAAVATGYPVRMIPAPATLPVAEVVRRLNKARPPALLAHTSKLVTLAAEQRAGRLRIEPRVDHGDRRDGHRGGSPHDRGLVRDPAHHQFTSTEGLVGQSDPGSEVVSFAGDACIVELVDANNQPVPEGVASAKALVTNLHNHTQPLIRYELTDRFIRHPSARTGAVRATVVGRADDVFHYGDVAVDPLVIRTVMVRTPAALEYQVRQTAHGIDIAIVAEGELNPAALRVALGQSLLDAGLPNPRVRVREVTDIERHPETGKARRFIPV